MPAALYMFPVLLLWVLAASTKHCCFQDCEVCEKKITGLMLKYGNMNVLYLPKKYKSLQSATLRHTHPLKYRPEVQMLGR